MNLLTSLSPELQKFIGEAAINAGGGIGAEFATRLLDGAGRRVCGLFDNEREEALCRVAGEAILAAIKDWQVAPADYNDGALNTVLLMALVGPPYPSLCYPYDQTGGSFHFSMCMTVSSLLMSPFIITLSLDKEKPN